MYASCKTCHWVKLCHYEFFYLVAKTFCSLIQSLLIVPLFPALRSWTTPTTTASTTSYCSTWSGDGWKCGPEPSTRSDCGARLAILRRRKSAGREPHQGGAEHIRAHPSASQCHDVPHSCKLTSADSLYCKWQHNSTNRQCCAQLSVPTDKWKVFSSARAWIQVPINE